MNKIRSIQLNQPLLEKLQSVIKYKFEDINLLKQAITHSSYANEHRYTPCKDNERLEFLGDAILDLLISEYLFNKYQEMPEGTLSKLRASIVCEASLAKQAKILELGKYILLGKGEEMTGGRERASILADAFEALTGSIFLDGGFKSAKTFMQHTLIGQIEEVDHIEELYTDYKTLLQECIQRSSTTAVVYEVVAEYGPDHDKYFEVAVKHEAEILGQGKGKSKKEAEQEAAKNAIYRLKK